MELLNITDFSCGYSEGFTIKEVNLSLKAGSFTGIIGPNGSGKSTLFKGIAGDLPPQSGCIKLQGQDFLKLSLKQRARSMAIVSQFAEFSAITVEDYLLMGRMPYRSNFHFFDTKEDKAIVTEMLERTGILHLKDKLITALSGGEQQMASIACALTQQPKILLLDEATSHLDITHQAKVMNLLQQLNEEDGLTVLMIIHDLNLASEYCSHLTMIKQGTIFKQGTPKEVLTPLHIKQVYDVDVSVETNPHSDRPLIFAVSNKYLSK